MEAANNQTTLIQKGLVPSPFQEAAKKQPESEMLKLPSELIQRIMTESLKSDPTNPVVFVCKAMHESFKEMMYIEEEKVPSESNSFVLNDKEESAGLQDQETQVAKSENSVSADVQLNTKTTANNLNIIARIISITSSDPVKTQERVLLLIKEVAKRAVKSNDFSILKGVLELPAAYGKKINQNDLGGLIHWVANHDLGDVIEVMANTKMITDVNVFMQLSKKCCWKGKVNVFKALLKIEAIPNASICKFYNLFAAATRNYIELVKLIQPHFTASLDYSERPQSIMDFVVQDGYVEMAKFLEEHSLGDLNCAILSEISLTAGGHLETGSLEMLQFALGRFDENGKPIVSDDHLKGILSQSLSENNKMNSIFIYQTLLGRDVKINYKQIITLAIILDSNVRSHSNIPFAYILLQGYEAKFGKTDKWGELAGLLLRREIQLGNIHAAQRLLDDPSIKPLTFIVHEIIANIEKNDANKDKWLEFLTTTLFHFKFNPITSHKVVEWKQSTQNEEAIKILNFYLDHSKFEIGLATIEDLGKLATKDVRKFFKKITLGDAVFGIVSTVGVNFLLNKYLDRR